MALTDDLQKSWRTAQPMTSPIGQDVQVRQVHISLFPKPVLHLGVLLGTRNADGTFDAKTTKTVVLDASQIQDLNPGKAANRAALLRTLMDTIYTILQEMGEIADGTRT